MRLKYFVMVLLLVPMFSACKIATIRSIDEDEEAKAGFNAAKYVDSIWDSKLIPTFQDEAVEVTQLLQQLDANQNTAIQTYGHRSGTGEYSFMIYGEAKAIAYSEELRIGRITLDFAPYDGQSDASILTGPVIPRRNNALRDAVGFINFNDFVNQTEFADVSSALKDRVIEGVIGSIDLQNIDGKTLKFHGAFSLVDRSNIEIVPVIIEVQE